MNPIPFKRLTNRLAHVSGQVAMNHVTLTSLCPPEARRCDNVDQLEASIDRAWHLTLKASKTLQLRLQRLSDRLTAGDDEASTDDGAAAE